MSRNSWNPRNRSMAYVPNEVVPNGNSLAHHLESQMVVYETLTRLHQELYPSLNLNSINPAIPPFLSLPTQLQDHMRRSSLNNFRPVQHAPLASQHAPPQLQRNIFRASHDVLSPPQQLPQRPPPRNYMLELRPTPPAQVHPLTRRNHAFRFPPAPLVLPPPTPPLESHSRAATGNAARRPRLTPLVREGESSRVMEGPPAGNLTRSYLEHMDRPIEVVVDLVESDDEDNAANKVDLNLKL